MNISLPDVLKTYVDQQVAEGGYSSSSEFVRELIRRDLERGELGRLLLQGGDSPPTQPVDDSWFDAKRERVSRTTRA